MERDDLYVTPVIKKTDTYEKVTVPSIPGYSELDKSRPEGRDGIDGRNYEKLWLPEQRSGVETHATTEPYEEVI